MRIPAGQKQTMQLDRDSGATLYEEQEIRTASGIWDRQQYATPIPPAAFYDVSVYEEILQSIAIDRTGKSPNPIEDVNYQPKSLGWLQLPPGQGLQENGSLDLYELGKAAKNPGAVRRIDRELLKRKTAKRRSTPINPARVSRQTRGILIAESHPPSKVTHAFLR